MSGLPAPEHWSYRWLKKPYAYDILIALFAALGGSAGVIRSLEGPKTLVALFLGVGVSFVFVSAVIKAIIQIKAAGRDESMHELQGCLEVLHSIVVLIHDVDKKAGLRITLHKPLDHSDEFIQVIEYVGDRRGGVCVGRKFNSQAGIIGACKRSGGSVWANRENDVFDDYVKELVVNWRFSGDSAEAVNQATMSWYAVPLTASDGRLAGVVYLDSIRPAFFDDAELRKQVESACAGIARFVDKRYS